MNAIAKTLGWISGSILVAIVFFATLVLIGFMAHVVAMIMAIGWDLL